jgi:heme O synthase-like polyprenyltransferase
MLPQEVLAVVVSVGRSHHAMNVLLGGLAGVFCVAVQIGWALMVEFDQDDGALDTVVKGAIGL